MLRSPALVGLAVALTAVPVLAAERTFVSTKGNDADACSLAAPCRSFAAALVMTDEGGEIFALDSGTYGRVRIDKSVTIQAPVGVYAGILVYANRNGIDINTPGVNVVLRGLSIDGLGGGDGIRFEGGASLRVERCVITNMAMNGIVAIAPGATVTLDDVLVKGSGRAGVSGQGLAVFTAKGLEVERSGGDGVFAGNVRSVAIRTSRVVKAGSSGIVVQANAVGWAVDAVLDHVLVSEAKLVGVLGFVLASAASGNVDPTPIDSPVEGGGGIDVETVDAGPTLTLSDSTIVRNWGFGVASGPGTVVRTRGNNTIRGNSGADPMRQTFGTITPLAGS